MAVACLNAQPILSEELSKHVKKVFNRRGHE